jgi:hypothetical protein
VAKATGIPGNTNVIANNLLSMDGNEFGYAMTRGDATRAGRRGERCSVEAMLTVTPDAGSDVADHAAGMGHACRSRWFPAFFAWPRLVVFADPPIEIGLQLVD